MARGDAERIRNYLTEQVEEARNAGRAELSFRAGDVSRVLRVDSANVSQALKGKRFHAQAGVRLLDDKTTGPPGGAGGNLTCHFEVIGARAAPAAAAAASAQGACCPPDDGVRERLARLEAIVESLVRDSDGAKADVRALNARIDSLYTSGEE